MDWGYRYRQFLTRLLARRKEIDDNVIQLVLEQSAWPLFYSMPVGDQIHAQAVLHTLQESGIVSKDLAQAALLHDVGKAQGRLTLVHRGLIVILDRVRPSLCERLGSPHRRSWRYPFHVHRCHAELGASLCEQMGCSPLTVALIRHHEDPIAAKPGTEPEFACALALLRRADDRN